MNECRQRSFRQILFTHFMPCFFLGLITISLFEIKEQGTDAVLDSLRSLGFYHDCFLNGLMDAAAVIAFHLFQNHRFKNNRISPIHMDLMAARHRPPHEILLASLVAFLAGSISIILILFPPGLVALTLLIVLLTLGHLRLFFGRVAQILAPDSRATWRDVGTFFFNYATILCAFTLINVSLEIIHHALGRTLPFNFASNSDLFVESLYFTSVVMTTLGFGDYTPQTVDAKLLITMQCWIGYIMFALMVGCITKGVIPSGDKEC